MRLRQMVSEKHDRAFPAKFCCHFVIACSVVAYKTVACPLINVNFRIGFGLPSLIYIFHRNALVVCAEM